VGCWCWYIRGPNFKWAVIAVVIADFFAVVQWRWWRRWRTVVEMVDVIVVIVAVFIVVVVEMVGVIVES